MNVWEQETCSGFPLPTGDTWAPLISSNLGHFPSTPSLGMYFPLWEAFGDRAHVLSNASSTQHQKLFSADVVSSLMHTLCEFWTFQHTCTLCESLIPYMPVHELQRPSLRLRWSEWPASWPCCQHSWKNRPVGTTSSRTESWVMRALHKVSIRMTSCTFWTFRLVTSSWETVEGGAPPPDVCILSSSCFDLELNFFHKFLLASNFIPRMSNTAIIHD